MVVDMSREMWYNRIVGVATHSSAVSDQGEIRPTQWVRPLFHIQEGARQSPVSLIAERGRTR